MSLVNPAATLVKPSVSELEQRLRELAIEIAGRRVELVELQDRYDNLARLLGDHQ